MRLPAGVCASAGKVRATFRQLYWGKPVHHQKRFEYIHRRLLGRPTYGREELNRYYDLVSKTGFYGLVDALNRQQRICRGVWGCVCPTSATSPRAATGCDSPQGPVAWWKQRDNPAIAGEWMATHGDSHGVFKATSCPENLLWQCPLAVPTRNRPPVSIGHPIPKREFPNRKPQLRLKPHRPQQEEQPAPPNLN